MVEEEELIAISTWCPHRAPAAWQGIGSALQSPSKSYWPPSTLFPHQVGSFWSSHPLSVSKEEDNSDESWQPCTKNSCPTPWLELSSFKVKGPPMSSGPSSYCNWGISVSIAKSTRWNNVANLDSTQPKRLSPHLQLGQHVPLEL